MHVDEESSEESDDEVRVLHASFKWQVLMLRPG
jgi:hypothetical protein